MIVLLHLSHSCNVWRTGGGTIFSREAASISRGTLSALPSEVGIYKRKEASKKTRNQAFDRESDEENKKKKIENMLSTKKATKKKKILFFLLSCFLL